MRRTKEINKKKIKTVYKCVGASIARPQLQRLAQNNGITLLAIVITIVIMLILASISVNVAINGGLFEYAGEAKHVTENAQQEQILQKAVIVAQSTSKTGIITVEDMQKALNKVAGEGVATATNKGEAIFIKFEQSEIYYNVDSEGKIENIIPYEDTTPGVLAQNSDGAHMIESIEDLVVFSAIINGYSDENINKPSPWSNSVVLMRDLDFKSTLSYNDSTTTKYNAYLGIDDKNVTLMEALTNTEKYKGFIPIGCQSSTFSGTFDGQNHYIRNLSENLDTYGGLFGYVGIATIQNITVTGEVESTTISGGIVGYAGGITNRTFSNCTNYVNVSGTICGGVLGYSYNGSSFLGCINYGNITASSSAGGIAGEGRS